MQNMQHTRQRRQGKKKPGIQQLLRPSLYLEQKIINLVMKLQV